MVDLATNVATLEKNAHMHCARHKEDKLLLHTVQQIRGLRNCLRRMPRTMDPRLLPKIYHGAPRPVCAH